MNDSKDQQGHGAEHDFTGPLSPPVARFIRVFSVISVVLFLLDFVVKRKTHAPGESFPGFYAIYGFVGCVVLVLIAKEMRKVVMRDESYYDSDPFAEAADDQGGEDQ